MIVEATREAADTDITLAPIFTPPTVTPTPKPVAKGQTKGEIGVTVARERLGPTPLTFRADQTKMAARTTPSRPPRS